MPQRPWAATAAALLAVTLCACTATLPGRALRGSSPAHTDRPAARNLLLRDGDTTPLGPASERSVGDSYFTTARPPECAAAVVFKGSSLPPPGASDHAESSYGFGGKALYAEAANVYDKTLNAEDVVRAGFTAVSGCTGDATAVSPAGDFGPIHLSYFATLSDGVLVWRMTRPDWTCDYGLAVVPRATLLMSACDTQPGFPMADWAAKRRTQLSGQAS
jgi:hypothetical protein